MTSTKRCTATFSCRPTVLFIVALCITTLLFLSVSAQQTEPDTTPADDPPPILSLLADQQQLLDEPLTTDLPTDPPALPALDLDANPTHTRLSTHSRHVHTDIAVPEEDPNRLVAHGSHFHTAAEFAASSGYILLLMIATVIACQAVIFYCNNHNTHIHIPAPPDVPHSPTVSAVSRCWVCSVDREEILSSIVRPVCIVRSVDHTRHLEPVGRLLAHADSVVVLHRSNRLGDATSTATTGRPTHASNRLSVLLRLLPSLLWLRIRRLLSAHVRLPGPFATIA